MIEVRDLYYTYPDNNKALNGVNFTVNAGEKVALVGANGSGKSTLLLHLAGAIKPQHGIITTAKTGLIFQDADDQILMPSVIEDVAFSLVANGMKVSQAHERALNMLESLGIAHLAERVPHKLSGGEKRMVSLAGVLITNPDILLLDEPTANLDPKSRRRVINFLRESDKTIILATHDLDMALDICTRALIMNNGVISCEGVLPEIFAEREILEANNLELPMRFMR